VLKDILMTVVWRVSFSLGSLLLYFHIFSEFLYCSFTCIFVVFTLGLPLGDRTG